MARGKRRSGSAVIEAGAWASKRTSLALAGGLLILAIGLPHVVSARVGEVPFLVDPSRISVVKSPAWFESTAAASLKQDIAALAGRSLREDAELLELVEQVGLSSGWIRAIERVQKHYPDRLELHLDLRKPLVRVSDETGEFLVDADGVVVGRSEEAPELIRARRIPLILRPGGSHRFVPGKAIEDFETLQALKVAREILPHRRDFERLSLDIALIDVSPLVARRVARISDVDLITTGGTRLQWGRPAGSSKLGKLEPAVATKMAHLRQAARMYPGFDSVQIVRLQFDVLSVMASPSAGPPRQSDAYQETEGQESEGTSGG